MSLLTRPRLTVFTLGGRLRNVTFAEVGDWAARALAEINVDVAFLGTNGISLTRGLDHARPRRGGRQAADARAARPSASCWPTTASSASSRAPKHGDLDDIDLLISDTGLTDDQYSAITHRRNRSGARMIVTLTPNPSVDRTVFLDRHRARFGQPKPTQLERTQRQGCQRRPRAARARGAGARRSSPQAVPSALTYSRCSTPPAWTPSSFPSPARSAATSA